MDRSTAWTAHAALCRSVDALNPAWPHLTTDEKAKLQRLVERIEFLRDTVSARAAREDAGSAVSADGTSRSSRWRQ